MNTKIIWLRKNIFKIIIIEIYFQNIFEVYIKYKGKQHKKEQRENINHRFTKI